MLLTDFDEQNGWGWEQMRFSDGTLTTSLEDTLECFARFYETHYYYSSYPSYTAIDNFLDTLTIPQILEEDRSLLDSSIQESEVLQTIEKLKMDRAPGLDGFTAVFY